jgi:chromosomal replication initiator protein DnaA
MIRCDMNDKTREIGPGLLPDFLRVSVDKGIVDERTAHRIELLRRSRGLGKYEAVSAFMNDPPDPTLTFDNYLVCKGNSFAVELAKTVAHDSPSRLPYNPLYFYGDIGLGKTHLLSAIANAATDKEALLINTADLEMELERAARLKSRAELTERLASTDILMVDDIQLCEGREDVQRDLFSVLNHMTRTQRWVVISSDVPPTRLAGVESRLLSRLRGGVIVSLQMGDGSERRDLIRHFLSEHPMSEEVVDYLADNITDNVRRLKAAVAQLLTLHEWTQTPLSVDLVQAVVPLPESSGTTRKAPPNISDQAPITVPRTPTTIDARVGRFKEMLAGADSEEEQSLALQIALGERIRQLRNAKGDPQVIQQFEQALDLLRKGSMEDAIRCLST